MTFVQKNGLRYFTFRSFDHPEVTHAIFTRQGGFSPWPWDSLNMGSLVGDDRLRVEKNRILAFKAVGRKPETMYDVWQVHSARIICVEKPRPVDIEHQQADAILTDNPEVTLFMRFADCVPIFLFDPKMMVVGLVHAGWRGTVKKIASAAINSMIMNYGSNRENILAGIGPSISAAHYHIGQDVEEMVSVAFATDADKLLCEDNGKVTFNLWEANRILLKQAGLGKIEVSGLCTASNPDDWFSYRGESHHTGRFGALIGLK